MIDLLCFLLAPGRLLRLGLPAVAVAILTTVGSAWGPAVAVGYDRPVVFSPTGEAGKVRPVARAFASSYRFEPVAEADARAIGGVVVPSADPPPWAALERWTSRLFDRPLLDARLTMDTYAHEVRGWPFPALAWAQIREDPRGLPNRVVGGWDLGSADRGPIELGPFTIDAGSPEVVGGGMRKIPWPAPSADIPDPRKSTFVSNRVLPLTPVWPGLGANLVFYTVTIYLALAILASLRAGGGGAAKMRATTGLARGGRPFSTTVGSAAAPVIPFARGIRPPDD